MTDDVLIASDGWAGRLRLNRPRAIKALTEAMCTKMIAALRRWQADADIEVIIVDQAEGRGFCAGGDVPSRRRSPPSSTKNTG